MYVYVYTPFFYQELEIPIHATIHMQFTHLYTWDTLDLRYYWEVMYH